MLYGEKSVNALSFIFFIKIIKDLNHFGTTAKSFIMR